MERRKLAARRRDLSHQLVPPRRAVVRQRVALKLEERVLHGVRDRGDAVAEHVVRPLLARELEHVVGVARGVPRGLHRRDAGQQLCLVEVEQRHAALDLRSAVGESEAFGDCYGTSASVPVCLRVPHARDVMQHAHEAVLHESKAAAQPELAM